MNTRGQHLIIDAYECQPEILNDAEALKSLLIKALDDLGMEILSVHFHSFSPQGVTGVISISTSHFSIHTWPEYCYAALDLYTCGDQEIWPTFKNILYKLNAKSIEVNEIIRGEKVNYSPRMRNIDPVTRKVKRGTVNELIHVEAERGNSWDNIQLTELAKGDEHEVLFHGSSQFQDIFLVRANDIRLYLNQELQFSSIDEKRYHEALVLPIMEMVPSHNRVLILGGGDGLGLREVLKYPTVQHVDLVDIDPMMVYLGRTNPNLLEINKRSYLDERVQVHNEDARQFVERSQELYDVIIIDFPDPADSIVSSLYTKELFNRVGTLLQENGMVVCQSTSPEDTPKAFWSIGETMKNAGFYTIPYKIIVPSFGLWGFHLAASQEFNVDVSKFSVQHDAISNDITPMFNFTKQIKSHQKNAIVNSIENLKLHEVFQSDIKNRFI